MNKILATLLLALSIATVSCAPLEEKVVDPMKVTEGDVVATVTPTPAASPTSTDVPTPTLRAALTPTTVPTATPTLAPTASPRASMDLQLRIAETVLDEATGLAITLVEVSEDSRCPSGLTCFWPGQATVVVNLVEGDRALGDFSLTLNPDREDLAAAIAEGHFIKLVSLDPYPISTRRTQPEEYIASLVLSKR